jgi:Family of unknown function (DUF6338)
MEPFKNLKELSDLIPVLVFLLPGFVSSGIVALLVIRKPAEPFGQVIEAFIFTMLNLALFTVLRSVVMRIPGLRLNNRDFFTSGNLLMMTFCAVVVGLAWSYEANNQIIFRLLRKLKLTGRTTKPSVWIDVFSENRTYVVVHLKDERRVYGWPRRYSDDASERVIYLEQATWLGEDNEELNDPPIDILLDKDSEIAFMEFVPGSQTPKRAATEPKQDVKYWRFGLALVAVFLVTAAGYCGSLGNWSPALILIILFAVASVGYLVGIRLGIEKNGQRKAR